ncbi:LOB domain-containing protein 15-like [Zingiber officinale]|uniref:LOB domain-containing protein 15-like n=1 Tax=Zingiber officinale TaxID=94328 RepID=UPI001C4CA969|nr:LOB domain-containing protein 15-like [Zingiber officinale]
MSSPREKVKREVEAPSIPDRAFNGRQLGAAGTNLNTITPCAACKLLRRRCAQDCPFSPYFSPQEPQKFASVHRVFGASNVSKMLMEVPEPQRADAANSLVYEANLRLRDPIYGCMGAISALQQQVQALEAELKAVRTEILKHKYRQQAAAAAAANNVVVIPTSALLGPSPDVAAPPPAVLPPPAVHLLDGVSGYRSINSPSSIARDHNLSYFG